VSGDNLADVQDKDRFDMIMANPPFGGKERPEVQQNFPIKTGETAFLFLQHFIKTCCSSPNRWRWIPSTIPRSFAASSRPP
jgi:type I restriction-modification system DNA methylase subunit